MHLDIWYSGFGVRNRIDSVLLARPSLIPPLFYGLPVLDVAGIARNARELPRAHKTYCASARITADTQLSCTE